MPDSRLAGYALCSRVGKRSATESSLCRITLPSGESASWDRRGTPSQGSKSDGFAAQTERSERSVPSIGRRPAPWASIGAAVTRSPVSICTATSTWSRPIGFASCAGRRDILKIHASIVGDLVIHLTIFSIDLIEDAVGTRVVPLEAGDLGSSQRPLGIR